MSTLSKQDRDTLARIRPNTTAPEDALYSPDLAPLVRLVGQATTALQNAALVIRLYREESTGLTVDDDDPFEDVLRHVAEHVNEVAGRAQGLYRKTAVNAIRWHQSQDPTSGEVNVEQTDGISGHLISNALTAETVESAIRYFREQHGRDPVTLVVGDSYVPFAADAARPHNLYVHVNESLGSAWKVSSVRFSTAVSRDKETASQVMERLADTPMEGDEITETILVRAASAFEATAGAPPEEVRVQTIQHQLLARRALQTYGIDVVIDPDLSRAWRML